MEQVVDVVNRYCTFPMVERVVLLKRVLFSFLIGNEDMHLKNFSLIVRGGKTTLSPAYDLLNTTLLLGSGVKEEIALPLNGKKHNLRRKTLVDYFARGRLELNEATVNEVLAQLTGALPMWTALIDASFLTEGEKRSYQTLLARRCDVLGLLAAT